MFRATKSAVMDMYPARGTNAHVIVSLDEVRVEPLHGADAQLCEVLNDRMLKLIAVRFVVLQPAQQNSAPVSAESARRRIAPSG